MRPGVRVGAGVGGRGKARARAGRVVGRGGRVGEGRRRRLGDWARMVALLKPWMGKETERRRGGEVYSMGISWWGMGVRGRTPLSFHSRAVSVPCGIWMYGHNGATTP